MMMIYCATSAAAISVPFGNFKIEKEQNGGNQLLANIIKVGCASGYVKFRGKCRKKWCK